MRQKCNIDICANCPFMGQLSHWCKAKKPTFLLKRRDDINLNSKKKPIGSFSITYI
jgi:hypothetical protein